MIVYNNQQQLTRLCSFQEYFVLLQSPPRNNGNQGQHAMIVFYCNIDHSLYKLQTLIGVIITSHISIDKTHFII